MALPSVCLPYTFVLSRGECKALAMKMIFLTHRYNSFSWEGFAPGLIWIVRVLDLEMVYLSYRLWLRLAAGCSSACLNLSLLIFCALFDFTALKEALRGELSFWFFYGMLIEGKTIFGQKCHSDWLINSMFQKVLLNFCFCCGFRKVKIWCLCQVQWDI